VFFSTLAVGARVPGTIWITNSGTTRYRIAVARTTAVWIPWISSCRAASAEWRRLSRMNNPHWAILSGAYSDSMCVLFCSTLWKKYLFTYFFFFLGCNPSAGCRLGHSLHKSPEAIQLLVNIYRLRYTSPHFSHF